MLLLQRFLRRRQEYPSRIILRARGFSLIELLLVFFLTTLIGVVVIGLVSHSTALVSLGSEKMITQQKSRSAIAKMGPYLSTAVPGSNRPAIIVPALKSDTPENPTYDLDVIQLNTTEDFLAPGYDPRTVVVNPVSTQYFLYEFKFVRVNASDPNSLGRIELRRLNPSTLAVDTTVTPRIMAHNVQGLRCLRLGTYVIEVRIDTRSTRRGPHGSSYTKVETEISALAVPSGSYDQ